MTQEEKQLLLKDLCARLPYGVIVRTEVYNTSILEPSYLDKYESLHPIAYLRPISNITKEEVDKLFSILNIDEENETEWLKVNNINVIRLFTQEGKDFYEIAEAMDYLHSIHIDYRGLIEKGLALEAPEEMY